MSLITVAEPKDGKPQMHVLIIGVGDYRYLPDELGKKDPAFKALKKLSSPPVSARALADWFLKQDPKYIPVVPLGTIELLLSDSQSQQYQVPGKDASIEIQRATMENIEQAFNDWEARCSRNSDNIAFFYFGGHGLWKGANILLPEDFGRNPHNPWKTAIDFDATYTGMVQCAAETQYFVVDTCRQWTEKMLKQLDVRGNPLMTTTLGKWTSRTAPNLFGSAIGGAAFGDTGQVSRLTSALLQCLEGGGSDKVGGEWVINTDYLGLAVQKIIEAQNKALPMEARQSINPLIGDQGKGTRTLYRLKDVIPKSVVTLGCRPGAAEKEANFYYKRRGEEAHVIKKKLETDICAEELEAGVYDEFGVSFAHGGFRDVTIQEEFVRPPVWPVILDTEEVINASS